MDTGRPNRLTRFPRANNDRARIREVIKELVDAVDGIAEHRISL